MLVIAEQNKCGECDSNLNSLIRRSEYKNDRRLEKSPNFCQIISNNYLEDFRKMIPIVHSETTNHN